MLSHLAGSASRNPEGMARVLYAAEARKDLESIYGYTVEEWSVGQAKRYLGGLRKKCDLLADHPRMAPAAASGSSLRVALYREHRLLYLPIAGGIEVLRIVHQARDFAATLERLVAVRGILRKTGEG